MNSATLTIQIIGSNGQIKAQASGQNSATLVYTAAYQPEDNICLQSNSPIYIKTQLEDSIMPSFCWLSSSFSLPIPFEEKRVSYSPKSFTGETHLLWARVATPAEIAQRRNFAQNPLDHHTNTGLYPHATANVETRGEAVFAARNAIDGLYANEGHGPWPYQSWGINRQEDAEIRIDFGRPVLIDEVGVTLRADFPHDNWWQTASILFSDNSQFQPQLVKTGSPQRFAISPRTVSWAVMNNMQKNEEDPSPFPALTQLEFWGTNQ